MSAAPVSTPTSSTATSTPAPPPAPPRRASARRLLELARPEAGIITFATFCLLVGSVTSLIAPQGLRILMDAVSSGKDEHLGQTMVIFLIIFTIGSAFIYMRAYLFTLAGERVVMRLRTRLFDRLLRQEIAFFDKEKTGELLNRLAADTGVLQNAATVNVSMALRGIMQALGSFGVLAWTSWRLTLMMLAVVPVVAVGAVAFGRTVRSLSKRTQDALAQASQVAEQSLSNVRTVRSFAREPRENARYTDRVGVAFAMGRESARAYGAFQGGLGLAAYAAIALVLWYGARQVMDGQLTVGDLSAFMLYTMYLAFGLASLSSLWSDFNRALGASERVFELLDREPALPISGGKVPDRVPGDVKLQSVTFAYPARSDVTVLKGVDLHLPPGKVVALVGPSGGGKSTIAALLARFYDPDSGAVLLDGVDIRELDPAWLRSQVGAVSQEPALFAVSIEENIRYGRLDATQAQVEEAARAAHAHDFITAFPSGYQTLVGERGVQLSGGQKQRIAIARALLKDPRILVLDEATSALDAESEHLVQKALERLMQGRTVLVIAHRLSTVQTADTVVVLQDGRIAEQGAHAQLVALDGIYRKLVERQFARA